MFVHEMQDQYNYADPDRSCHLKKHTQFPSAGLTRGVDTREPEAGRVLVSECVHVRRLKEKKLRVSKNHITEKRRCDEN
jgi:hypothetical protein